MVVDVTKIFGRWKAKCCLNIENNVIEKGKVQETFFFCTYVWKAISQQIKNVKRNIRNL